MIRALLLGLLLLLGACKATPEPKARDADPALWVVRDADTTIYLFGTVHMMRPGLTWFDEAVRKAFDASDALVLELVMPPEDQMQALVAELGTTKSGPILPQQLPPALAAKLRAALPQAGMSPDALDHAEPWLAAMTLSVQPLRQLGYDDKDGAEQVLNAAARAAGKPIVGLETARQQFGYFDRLSAPAQRQLLETTLDDLPNAATEIETMVQDWSAGDADALARLLNADLDRAPELKQALLVTRNRNWANWIAARMRQPGTVFVAVGAGHLAGTDSVQAELAKRGLKVERVRY
ncbi:TraB/GumN family protein [Sphingomonas sp. dw_22]|uniref:TraB/GumN family protein n=1 Tax=Sphingomonas sp. dw_22 TaxID=2721175 RepID=UPI001BD59BF6|nr:TraB/GumN family protein [Sphingomonas sp. dw_22]